MALPSISDFRTRFPEFADTGDPAITLAIADAGKEVDDAVWMEKYYSDGVLFLAAHFLTGSNTQAEETEDGGGGGLVRSESLGRFSVTYDNGSSSSGSLQDELMSTEYGLRYKRLLKKNSKRLLIV